MEKVQNTHKFYFKSLILDFTATSSSVLFFQFLYVFGKVSGAVNWEMVIFDFLTGLFSYWSILYFFNYKFRFDGLAWIFFSIILGSFIWALCHAGYIFYFDWRYLSDIRPETFCERNLWAIKNAFLYFTPILSISSLIFVGLLRLVGKVFKFTKQILT